MCYVIIDKSDTERRGSIVHAVRSDHVFGRMESLEKYLELGGDIAEWHGAILIINIVDEHKHEAIISMSNQKDLYVEVDSVISKGNIDTPFSNIVDISRDDFDSEIKVR